MPFRPPRPPVRTRTTPFTHLPGFLRVRANIAGLRAVCCANLHPAVGCQVLPEARLGHRSPHPLLDPPPISHDHDRALGSHHRGHSSFFVLSLHESGGCLCPCGLK